MGGQAYTDQLKMMMGTALTECIFIFNTAHLTMTELVKSPNPASDPSFQRYFRDQDFQLVESIFSKMWDQLGVKYGSVTNPNWQPDPNCYWAPYLLPIKVYYMAARADMAQWCVFKDTLDAYVENRPPDGEPGTSPTVPFYIVVCDNMFKRGPNGEAITLDNGRDPGLWASGYGGFMRPDGGFTGGMWSIGAAIAHELLHDTDIYYLDTRQQIIDQYFMPTGFSEAVMAYSAWECQELKR